MEVIIKMIELEVIMKELEVIIELVNYNYHY